MRLFVILTVLFLALTSFVPAEVAGVKIDFATVIAIVLAIYEALSRIIPTNKTWSIIGKILEFLTWLNNLFDRKKK